MSRIKMTLEGMSCQHCVGTVRNALNAIPGVRVEDVSVGTAVLEVEGLELMAQVRNAVEEEEFKVLDYSEV